MRSARSAFDVRLPLRADGFVGAAELLSAEIPFVVEAWAETLDEDDDTRLSVYVNRTPVTGNIEVARDKTDIDFFGCGLSNTVAETTEDGAVRDLPEPHDVRSCRSPATARLRTSIHFFDEISNGGRQGGAQGAPS